MFRGKHLSLEEARKSRKLKQFAKEHPSKGDKTALEKAGIEFIDENGGGPGVRLRK